MPRLQKRLTSDRSSKTPTTQDKLAVRLQAALATPSDLGPEAVISSGDLLHGDRHGLVKIPLSVANEIPMVATKLKAEELELIQFCRSPHFSLKELGERIRNMDLNCDLPWRGAK